MIKRFIQRVGESPDVEMASPLTVDDLVSTPRSGLLVAEGGMGKSKFLEELNRRLTGKATFVRLAYFSGNQQGLANKIEDAAKADPGHMLILDGLDESVDLAGTLCQCIPELPDDIHVWIASRECRQLAAVSDALKKLVRYRLLPFSENDIKTRAQEEKHDVSAVEDLLREHDLWSLCGNPLGCDFFLKAFKQNKDGGTWSSREIWRQGVLSLCDENPSSTKALDPNACRFSKDQIFDCAAWIALNLSLSGKNAVFMGIRETDCPPSAMPVSVLSDGKDVLPYLVETTVRRLFASWDGGCAGFAHAMYGDYLAANGFQKHVPRSQWESLLLDHENRCLFAQRMGVAQWLMTDDAELADQVFELSPESFLTRDLARLKMDVLCPALLDRAESVLSQLWWSGGRSLSVLKSETTLETLRAFFSAPDFDGNRWATELAIDIARACEYWDLLADFALDETKDDARRQDAVFALSRCPDIEIKRRLRPLLDLLADKSDRWRGSLLLVCWPDVLSVDDVLPFVVFPYGISVTSSGYCSFLRHGFFGPLLDRIDPAVSPTPLVWANDWLKEMCGRRVMDELKEGARAVYSRFWNFAASAQTETLVSLLTDGYLAANKNYESPYFYLSEKEYKIYDWRRAGVPQACVWTHEAFVGQRELRFAVLREIVTRHATQSISSIALGIDWALLQNEDDLIRLAEIFLSAPFSDDAEQWGQLLRYSWNQRFLETQGEIVDQIHVARPDLFPKTCGEILAEGEEHRKRRDETHSKHRAVMEEDAAERAAWQQQVDRKIKGDLATDNTPPEQFARISEYLYTANGDFEDWDELDVRQAVGWKKLTGDEQERLIRLAARFLCDVPPPDDAKEKGIDLAWHRALIVLKRLKPDLYDRLPEAIWRKCAVELLRFHVNDACQELYDDLARKFPAIVCDALIRCVTREYGVAVLNAWERRLTAVQADAVWTAVFGSEPCDVDDSHPVRCFSVFPSVVRTSVVDTVCEQILSCLARYQPDVLRRRVNERLKDGFAVHLGHPFYNVLRRFALQLDAESYFAEFLQTLYEHVEWGRRWFETPTIAYEWRDLGGFRNAFRLRSADEIGAVFEWLDGQYPSEKRPRHEGAGSFTPSVLDHIYDFKDDLFKVLLDSGKKGSARVVDALIAKCPGIFEGYAATSRRNEAAARLPKLSVEQIRELLKEKKAVIASVDDLRKHVLSLLGDYQTQLKGYPPSISRLWNTREPVSPKREEEVSDDLVLFLKDRVGQAIFANREVQISRKLAEDGETGTRTDIWIDCETVCQEKVSLCIEAKCSWNREAKTAIADQLVGRYMSAGRADAGILLLAWFHCAAWKTGRASVWASPSDAKTDLEQQVQTRKAEIKKPLDVFVLDCTL